MAKRTEERTDPVIGPGQQPEHKQRRLWWVSLVVFLALLGLVLLPFMLRHPTSRPKLAVSAPPASSPSASPPSAPVTGGVPATTYEAFLALPAAQQLSTMQAAMDHYNQILTQADRTLDPSSLAQVATGGELGVLQASLQTLIENGWPLVDQTKFTILHIVMSPQPYSFVSLDVQSTGTDQYLNPTTLQPSGTPETSAGRSSFSLVIEDGVWKVRDHIQEPTP